MSRATLDPQGFFRRIPLAPHQMTKRVTKTIDSIVLCHLGVPRLNAAEWSLTIEGREGEIGRYGFDELRRFPKVDVITVHQCAGSPLEPTVPTRRVCNLVWSGVRVSDLIAPELLRQANYLWSYGADYGTFSGVDCGNYHKDLPAERISEDVIVAYQLNGEPLPAEQGFPARLVVPGFYGTNSVKWLTKMVLADIRAQGPFTTTWYNDIVPGKSAGDASAVKPVWALAPESVIVSPAPETKLSVGRSVEIWGWAWSDKPVADVEISLDAGAVWLRADLEPRTERAWQRFSFAWQPERLGDVQLCVRAREAAGEWQPMAGARNAVHTVAVKIT